MPGSAVPPGFGPPDVPGDPHAPLPCLAEAFVRSAILAGTQTAVPGAWLLRLGRTPASDAAPARGVKLTVSISSQSECLSFPRKPPDT